MQCLLLSALIDKSLMRSKVFIITGGGSGIGKALALALAKRNKSVLIIGRREQLLQETASESSLIQYLCTDLSTQEGLNAVREFVENKPYISALINNAGTLQPVVPLSEITPEAWHQTLNTNLDAALFLPQKLYRQLTNGRVLNISSGAAYFAIKGWAAYCVSKAALSMLTQCWQLESDAVAFASVKPGIIDTDMQALARVGLNMDEAQVTFYNRLKQNNHLITPETVAEFLVWLLLDVDEKTYKSREWDIYDMTHHKLWLKAPHQVPHWES